MNQHIDVTLLEKRKISDDQVEPQNAHNLKQLDDNTDQEDQEQKIVVSDIDPTRTCLKNFEPHTDEKAILKFCNQNFSDNELKVLAISKQKNCSFCIINFETQQMRELFDSKVIKNKLKIKNRKLKIAPVSSKKVNEIHEKKINKIQQKEDDKEQERLQDPLQSDIDYEGKQPIQDRICPLYQMEYSNQITLKRNDFKSLLETICLRARKQLNIKKNQPKDDNLPEWIMNDSCVQMDDFIECEEANRFYYRNKQEFTVGFDHLKTINVGFTKSNFQKRVILVDSANKCCIASKISIQVAEYLEKYIRKLYETDLIEPYHKMKHTGFWRNVVVRDSQRNKEMIISISVADQNISKELFEKIKQDLIFLFENSQFEFKINCLSLLLYNDKSDCVPVEGDQLIIMGHENSYKEVMVGCQFQVSLSAFLQINIPQAEILYKAIQKQANITENTILLDICSGIGTISICIGKQAKRIIAIEMVQSACQDNWKNAELNNVLNLEVHASKCEDCINDVVKDYSDGTNEIVGIVDPPRAGLHPSVIKSLRTCKGLNKLVYVACNPNAVVENLLALCLPQNRQQRQGPPFTIVKAFGVDLFPQTKHYEAVFVLERNQES